MTIKENFCWSNILIKISRVLDLLVNICKFSPKSRIRCKIIFERKNKFLWQTVKINNEKEKESPSCLLRRFLSGIPLSQVQAWREAEPGFYGSAKDWKCISPFLGQYFSATCISQIPRTGFLRSKVAGFYSFTSDRRLWKPPLVSRRGLNFSWSKQPTLLSVRIKFHNRQLPKLNINFKVFNIICF